MQTEYTCGIYTARLQMLGWDLELARIKTVIALIDKEGAGILFNNNSPILTKESLIEIAVLMNNIKRQYKTLNTSIHTDRRGQGFDGIPDEE